MKKDIDAQFLCKDCARFNQCRYYDRRKEDSYICKYFHLTERSKGIWKIHDLVRHIYRCSECQSLVIIRFNFCPECGADMRCKNERI